MAAADFPSSPSDGQVYTVNGKSWVYRTANTSWNSITAGTTRSINYVIDGGGSSPSTGVWGQIYIPVDCTVTGWVLTADVAASGSAVVDVLRGTYTAFPTVSSIAGTDKPTLSNVQKNRNLAISAWGSTALVAGDILQFSLTSNAGVTRLNITLLISIP